MDPPNPPSITDRYEDLGLIGRGGMGEVRRVRDRSMDRVLAMKIQAAELAVSPPERARFFAEARVTATLQHPGIVPVHDCGELPDGRLWFTMPEVRGRTLSIAIEELHERETVASTHDPRFRRLVDIFVRVCDAVAFAHSRGVVHRDIKPDNIMIGEFGEVLVMDWGLARVGSPARCSESQRHAHLGADWRISLNLDATQTGEVLGTLAYMPPEQARGEVMHVGPRSDVYALGAVLFEILTGHTPYEGSDQTIWARLLNAQSADLSSYRKHQGSPELARICEKAMRHQPDDRYGDAASLRNEVREWLDDARRRDRALALVQQARDMAPQIETMLNRAQDLRARAKSILGRLLPHEPAEQKALGWRLEDEAAHIDREASTREIAWTQMLHSALNEVPDHPDALADLAHHYKNLLLNAEETRDLRSAARFEALLRLYDRGSHAALLAGEGRLSLYTDPPGAEVLVERYVPVDRRLVLEPYKSLGHTPIVGAHVDCGSFLLTLRLEGHVETRYPVSIGRGDHWNGVRPGSQQPYPIRLPSGSELGPGEVYVPAGWFNSGGDTEAGESLPRRKLWVDAFVIQRHPITNAQFLEFLNDLVTHDQGEEALLHCPRLSLGHIDRTAAELVYERDRAGYFHLKRREAAEELCWPVTFVDWFAATRYGEWFARKTGRPWRLPNELEWEKAARGVDGRFMPWGDLVEPTWACMLGSDPDHVGRVGIDAYPTDESIYGVRGTAGNVRDWCINRWKHEGPCVEEDVVAVDPASLSDRGQRAARGGAWMSAPSLSRLASRFASDPRYRFGALGFRLTRPLGGGALGPIRSTGG
jgi:serine/threonine protein kinase/formylglycine-generating enzyme required for sulfatase activity